MFFFKEENDNYDSKEAFIGFYISKGKANNRKVYISKTGKYYYKTKSRFIVYVEESQLRFREIYE